MYTLKSIARRGTSFVAAMALVVSSVGSAVLPATSAFADALNPLTNRSLTLSSSSPGWDYTDGSGNATYAPPNSGANGLKTGNYFDFKVSSGATVKAMSFQYCTTSAGSCAGPGDNICATGSVATNNCTGRKTNATAVTDGDKTKDLDIITSSPTEIGSGDFTNIIDTASANGDIKAIPGADIAGANGGTTPGNSIAGSYAVYYESAPSTWTQSTGWTLSTSVQQNGVDMAHGLTAGKNYMLLTQATGAGQALTAGQRVKVVFFASDTKFYITNPGSGAFFVKINTYNKAYNASPAQPDEADMTGFAPASEANIIDGGVTVANVMNHSIRIQTKVLETMQFSVGTVDPNQLSSADHSGNTVPSTLEKALFADTTGKTGLTTHSVCDPILGGMTPADPTNVIAMGNKLAENSLEVANTYATHSYWRLSSNSSAGATVYYSGNTLSNTVGDEIKEINSNNPGVKAPSQAGGEQFGLALTTASNTANADESDGTGNLPPLGTRLYKADYGSASAYEQGADDTATTPNGVDASTITDVGANASWHTPRLYPLVPKADYADGGASAATAQYAFNSNSTLIPVPIADENNQVVDCVTGRMKYIANIAATTPAGIYTTAINYIAAPQY